MVSVGLVAKGIYASCCSKHVDLAGISWLQSVINGNRVTFVPVAKENKYLECIVTMPQTNQVRAARILHKYIHASVYARTAVRTVLMYMLLLQQDTLKVGEELVKLGLGTMHEPSMGLKDRQVLAYKKSLASAQRWAQFRRNGYWHFARQPTNWWKFQIYFIHKMKSLLPTYIAKRFDV